MLGAIKVNSWSVHQIKSYSTTLKNDCPSFQCKCGIFLLQIWMSKHSNYLSSGSLSCWIFCLNWALPTVTTLLPSNLSLFHQSRYIYLPYPSLPAYIYLPTFHTIPIYLSLHTSTYICLPTHNYLSLFIWLIISLNISNTLIGQYWSCLYGIFYFSLKILWRIK